MAACPAPPAEEEEAPPAEEEEVPPVPEEEVYKWPGFFKVFGPSVTYSTYLLTVAWTPLHERDTGTKWRIVPESSSPLGARWLKIGEMDFWATGTTVVIGPTEATFGYATRDGGPFPIRMVWQGDVGCGGIAVRGDSRIKTFADIKPGTKISIWIGAHTLMQLYQAFCAWLQMTEDELIMVPCATNTAAERAILEGKADITYLSSTGTTAYEIASSAHGLRYLALPEDPEAEARYHEVAPQAMFGMVDFGVEEFYGVRGQIVPRGYFTSADVIDEETAYQLAKWLYENFDAYKDLYKEAPRMSLEYFRKTLDQTYAPVHEGTIRYLKEIGQWTSADDARQEYNVRLQNWYIEAYEDALAMADEKGIKVDPVNEEWVELWENYKKEIGIPRLSVMSDEEIAAGLAKLK